MSKVRLTVVLCAFVLLSASSIGAQAVPTDPVPLMPELPAFEPMVLQQDRTFRILPQPKGKDVSGDTMTDGTYGTLLLDGSMGNSGVFLQATGGTRPDVTVKLGDALWATDFSVLSPTNASLFSVRGDGRVGIGTYQPTHRLHTISVADAVNALYAHAETTVEAAAIQNDTAATLYGYSSVASGVTNQGSLTGARIGAYATGTGTVAATYGAVVDTGHLGTGVGTISSAIGLRIAVSKAATTTITSGIGLYIADVQASSTWAVLQSAADDRNYFAGDVGIGVVPTAKLHVAGDIKATGNAHFDGTVTGGNIKAKYQDIAEWVPATTDLAPGTVVILNRARSNEVMASIEAYDTTVAGVVSAQPGLSLGEEGDGKEQIATTGRVKVRVDARTTAIRVGDLLVTSDVPGTAMRSEPMHFNGRRLHQPGTILGKALEPLESGMGEILVLLSMQ